MAASFHKWLGCRRAGGRFWGKTRSLLCLHVKLTAFKLVNSTLYANCVDCQGAVRVSLKHETFLFRVSSEDTIAGVLSASWFRSEEPNRFCDLRSYSGPLMAQLRFKHF